MLGRSLVIDDLAGPSSQLPIPMQPRKGSLTSKDHTVACSVGVKVELVFLEIHLCCAVMKMMEVKARGGGGTVFAAAPFPANTACPSL